MVDRQVRQTRKNSQGDILALCSPGEGWSPRAKADAIRDIRDDIRTTYLTETLAR